MTARRDERRKSDIVEGSRPQNLYSRRLVTARRVSTLRIDYHRRGWAIRQTSSYLLQPYSPPRKNIVWARGRGTDDTFAAPNVSPMDPAARTYDWLGWRMRCFRGGESGLNAISAASSPTGIRGRVHTYRGIMLVNQTPRGNEARAAGVRFPSLSVARTPAPISSRV